MEINESALMNFVVTMFEEHLRGTSKMSNEPIFIIECGCYSVVDGAFVLFRLQPREKKNELGSFFVVPQYVIWIRCIFSRLYFNGKLNKLKIINSYKYMKSPTCPYMNRN